MSMSDEAFLAGEAAAHARRAPAIPILVIVSTGILVDRIAGLHLWGWIVASAATAVAASFLQRRPRAATLAVLLLWGSLAGGWHHVWWSTVRANDVSAWAPDDGAIVRLRATVTEQPWLSTRRGPTWNPAEESIWTTFTVDAEALDAGRGNWQEVSGACRVTMREAAAELQTGEQVEILGILELPRSAANPGDFDFREFLRAQQIRSRLTAERAACLRRLGQSPAWSAAWGRWRQQARSRAARLFKPGMSAETSAVAQALFLGVRRQLDEETREDFERSGLLHVLAISGVNVGLLAAWFWLGCRMLLLSQAWTRAIVLAGLLGYLFLTDADPPVWRATLVAVLAIGAGFLGRVSPPRQMIALAALAVLMLNPTDLFHAGAQLSFLSVVIVAEVLRWRAAHERRLREQEGLARPTWRRRCRRAIGDAYAVSTTIWLLTAPLVVYRFQLVSPAGLALNILLGPLVLIVMWLGYTVLLIGLLAPAAAAVIAPALHAALAAFLVCVRWGGSLEHGHLSVAGPALVWLIVFYSLAGGLLWSSPGSRRQLRSLQLLAIWTVGGLAWGLRPQAPGELRLTVLSVGHGLSVVVVAPSGRTLVYDAGGMFQERRVAESVLRSVWAAGGSSIDVLVLSHPDADHFNAVPRLLELTAVGSIGMHRTFVDERQRPVREVLDSAIRSSIPLVLLSAGQQLRLDPDVQIEVVHPEPGFDSEQDNANSLVLAITYAGRSVLLTGDLEADGLDALLTQPPRSVDVLLAPHHGSRRSNPRDLARWANPDHVIASSGDSEARAVLEDVYGAGASCRTTREDGAVTIGISSSGAIEVQPFRLPPLASR